MEGRTTSLTLAMVRVCLADAKQLIICQGKEAEAHLVPISPRPGLSKTSPVKIMQGNNSNNYRCSIIQVKGTLLGQPSKIRDRKAL